MNGNVPLLLHASVPPLRQAPCHGYSINHSIKQSNIHCFTFLPVPNFLPYIHTHTSVHAHNFWKERRNDLSELIVYLHLMKREREKRAMQGVGMVTVKFFLTPPVAAILATISYTPLRLSTEHYMHAHENLIPLRGKEKEITGGFVSHSAGSEQREIKKNG